MVVVIQNASFQLDKHSLLIRPEPEMARNGGAGRRQTSAKTICHD